MLPNQPSTWKPSKWGWKTGNEGAPTSCWCIKKNMLVKPHVLLVKTPFHSKWHVLDVHMNILRSLVYVGLYLYIWWLHHSVQPCFLGCYIAKKSMFVGWYRHIYIICFSLTPLTNANGFRFGNSMNGTKKSAKVDTVDVCVIGFTTLSQKEME